MTTCCFDEKIFRFAVAIHMHLTFEQVDQSALLIAARIQIQAMNAVVVLYSVSSDYFDLERLSIYLFEICASSFSRAGKGKVILYYENICHFSAPGS